MAHIEITIQEATLVIQSQVFCGTFTNTDENQKALFVFLRMLSCPETGKPLFTYQQLANAFGKKDRRDIENVVREFWKRGGDFCRIEPGRGRKKITRLWRLNARW